MTDRTTDGPTDDLPVEERIRLDDELPPEFQRELCSLSDIARNPRSSPLATLAAALLLFGFGYQSFVIGATVHPLAGLVAVGVAAVAYTAAKRFWAIQHRYVVRTLAREGELDRLR